MPIIRNRGFLQAGTGRALSRALGGHWAGTGRALGTRCIYAIHRVGELSNHSVASQSDLVRCSQTNAAAGPYEASIRISVTKPRRNLTSDWQLEYVPPLPFPSMLG